MTLFYTDYRQHAVDTKAIFICFMPFHLFTFSHKLCVLDFRDTTTENEQQLKFSCKRLQFSLPIFFLSFRPVFSSAPIVFACIWYAVSEEQIKSQQFASILIYRLRWTYAQLFTLLTIRCCCTIESISTGLTPHTKQTKPTRIQCQPDVRFARLRQWHGNVFQQWTEQCTLLRRKSIEFVRFCIAFRTQMRTQFNHMLCRLGTNVMGEKGFLHSTMQSNRMVLSI